MARRRITPLTQNGINPAAANVPSVMAAAMAVSANANLVNTNVYGVPNPMTRDGKRRTPSGNGNLTNHQRKLICEFYQRSGSVISQKDLAQWTKHEFGLKKTPAQSTISGILRRQHEFINMSSLELGIKKRRVVQHPELDNALANWVIQCAHRGINVQGDTTKEKAKHFAKMLGIPEEEQPEFSNGWLHSFQLRHNFSFRKFHGDTTSPTTSEKKKQVIKFTTLDALMEEARAYELRNIFCMSEMGLLYNLYPSTNTHVEQDRRATKRFVVAIACNADGSEKLQPLFVSHLEQPISFQQKTPEQHGLQYFHNPHAWMSGVIFSKWLQRLDFAMGSQKRTILLILHETRSHAVAHLELHHVVVYFIPESMTTLNPMTTDLLSTLKLNYRRHHLRHVLRKAETTTPDGIIVDSTKLCFQTHLLQAFAWMRQCWRELKPLTIERSWSMTQIVADRLPMRPELQMNQEAVAFEAEVTHLLCCLNVPQCMTLNELMTAEETLFENSIHEEFFEVVHTTDPVPDDEVDENELVVMSTTTTEANGQTGLNPSNNLRDANAGVTEAATTAANLSLQDKLKAFRDVLQVLQTRNDSDDTALTALRRVQDAIRNEAQEHLSAHVDVLHPMLQNQSTHMAMSMVEMNMDPSTVGSSAMLRQQVNNALEMVPTTDSEFHTVI